LFYSFLFFIFVFVYLFSFCENGKHENIEVLRSARVEAYPHFSHPKNHKPETEKSEIPKNKDKIYIFSKSWCEKGKRKEKRKAKRKDRKRTKNFQKKTQL